MVSTLCTAVETAARTTQRDCGGDYGTGIVDADLTAAKA